MAEVQIVYATRGGATHRIAEILANGLGAAGFTVETAAANEDPQPIGELVVLGSGIHVGKPYEELLSWVDRHRSTLDGRRVASYAACLSILDPEKQDEAHSYPALVGNGLALDSEAVFPGCYTPSSRNLMDRVMMTLMRKRTQDHIDPNQVRAWLPKLTSLLPQRG